MRLTIGCHPSYFQETSQFADWLLEHGEGKLGGYNDGNSIIEIPDDLFIGDSSDPIYDLIDFVYPALLDNFNDISYFQERAILAPLNEVVQDINDRFLTLFPGEEVEYLSSDSIDNSDSVGPGFDPALHSPDFLNGLKMFDSVQYWKSPIVSLLDLFSEDKHKSGVVIACGGRRVAGFNPAGEGG
ncbi:uncharacterized protein LOC143605148 [Bidens hawaiensis]|uniref:uncharacterized protein LOC143605148 n=1 Tax=Bidens hawaiensis TaxID=980011 RepID=UPI00404B8CC3